MGRVVNFFLGSGLSLIGLYMWRASRSSASIARVEQEVENGGKVAKVDRSTYTVLQNQVSGQPNRLLNVNNFGYAELDVSRRGLFASRQRGHAGAVKEGMPGNLGDG